MKKLKCWKKIEENDYSTTYANKKDGRKISLLYNAYANEYAVGKEVYYPIHDLKVIKYHLKTKPKALAFAQKYMEEHDSC